ncbi:Metallo-hydrolase/oxidoreductase [Byssothecium circinans]|uniref:Metallo-hydrolase/oxidoreductase n=1 Tax=Byssothecium circinans TaxID=147558 RepID=A0A6A5U6S2_9PLEO|nr:Metallo-hydrolase/oxidoreductase [Byssothecium circinans]
MSTTPNPSKTPKLNIPSSSTHVSVSIIDTGALITVPTSMFIADPLPGHESLTAIAFVFLIEHEPSGQKILFDLGIRKDFENLPPVVTALLSAPGLEVEVKEDVADVLNKDGRVRPEDVNAIIWSHAHLDHTGDPSTFPASTELVVGPGTKAVHLPGYPKNPDAAVRESDFANRNVREIDFEAGEQLRLGQFRAHDYFGDGSFYLLDCPGHTVGHMGGLARTTPSTFIFMGADTCHHCGSFRPSPHIALPQTLSPSPFSVPPWLAGSVCPGSLIEAIHPHPDKSEAFYKHLSSAPDRDVPEAEETIRKMQEFDASDDVLVMIAHDASLLGVVELFPKRANEWKEKGWKEQGRWRFLKDFKALADKIPH